MSTITAETCRTRVANDVAKLPRLRNGEHLSRSEFERRWDATPGLIRAELIEGIVFMPPPTSDTHSSDHGQIFHALNLYAMATPGVKAGLNASVRLDNHNEYQPDCLLRIISSKFGRSRISEEDYIEGPPELVTEIALSSADYDAHEKRAVYERMGVQEYFLWQVMDSRCDCWELQNGVYAPLIATTDGIIRSRVFPGLWIDVRALLSGNGPKMMTVLNRGIKSRDHADFVKRLKTK